MFSGEASRRSQFWGRISAKHGHGHIVAANPPVAFGFGHGNHMPTGWIIKVLRQAPDIGKDSTNACPAVPIAVWQTDLHGRDWLDKLVGEGRAALIAENFGYPYVYSARAKDLRP